MNLKLHEVVNLYYEINGLTKVNGEQTEVITEGILKQKTSLKVKVYLQRLNKIVSEEVKLYEESKKELYNKYGTESEGYIVIDKENMNDFNTEHNDLLTAERSIDVSTLWGTDLSIDNLESIETNEYYPTLIKLIDK